MPQQVVRVCDPHDDDTTIATATIRFILQGRWYSVDVCRAHEETWNHVVGEWAKYATALNRQPVELSHELASTEEDLVKPAKPDSVTMRDLAAQRAARARIPIPVFQTGEVINHDETLGADEADMRVVRSWGFSHHAQERMVERKIRPQEVWLLLQNSHLADRISDARRPEVEEWTLGNLSVVVNPHDRTVLTVYRPGVEADAASEVGSVTA